MTVHAVHVVGRILEARSVPALVELLSIASACSGASPSRALLEARSSAAVTCSTAPHIGNEIGETRC